MPTYEYACPNGHMTIDKRSIHDDSEPTECAECGGKLNQIIGSLGVSFKGNGFYSTDKRSKEK
jgi:putative FmdB family regulatory protein